MNQPAAEPLHRRLVRAPQTAGDLAVIVSASLILLSLARVYFFTGFDVPTTQIVVGVVDRTQLLLATLVDVATPFIAGMVLALLPVVRWRGPKTPPQVALATAIILIGVPIAVATWSAWVLPPVILLALYMAWEYRRRGKRHAKSDNGRVEAGIHPNIMAALLVVALVTTLARPWLPKEQLKLQDGRTVTGHVLGSQEGQMLVALDRSHVAWFNRDNVKARRICDVRSSSPNRSLLELLGLKDGYSPCI